MVRQEDIYKDRKTRQSYKDRKTRRKRERQLKERYRYRDTGRPAGRQTVGQRDRQTERLRRP